MDSYIHLDIYISYSCSSKGWSWEKINLRDLIYKDIVFSKFPICAKVTSHLD